MPVQTTKKNFLFPDGCQVLVKEYGASSYTDIGAIYIENCFTECDFSHKTGCSGK